MSTEKLVARVGADVSGFKQGLNSTVNIAKSTALKISAAFAGVGLSAALIGSKFEATLTETATVAQAFGRELEALEHKARELGKTTAFTATEAARGMYDLASAGMNTNEIIAATEHSMLLAGATGSEMAQATRLVASSLKQFGLEANQTKRITDTYSQAITKSQLTMERLTEAMKYAGTTGSGLGWTIEETTAAVAQFTNLGLEGSQAGTNLRMSMLSLTSPTEDAKKALLDMGLTIEDVDPTIRSFGDILRTLGERAMTAAQASEIFGRRAGLNMKQLSQMAAEGKLDFEAFVASLQQAQQGIGRTAEMYNRMMGDFKNRWKIMMSAFQELMIVVFKQFEHQGKEVFDVLSNKLNKLGKWVEENKSTITGFFTEVKDLAKKIIDDMEKWLKINEKLFSEDIPEGLKKLVKAFQNIWNIISYDPAIIEWGLVGLAIGGKKGAVLLGGMAHMVTWAQNLSKAIEGVSAGTITLSELANANFQELDVLVKRSIKDFDGNIKIVQDQIDRLKKKRESLLSGTDVNTILYGDPEAIKITTQLIASYDAKIGQLEGTLEKLITGKKAQDYVEVLVSLGEKAQEAYSKIYEPSDDLREKGSKPTYGIPSGIAYDLAAQETEQIYQEIKDRNEKNKDLMKEFNTAYAQIGLDRFTVERMQLEEQAKQYQDVYYNNAQKLIEIERWKAERMKEIDRGEWKSRLEFANQGLGQLASIFQQIAQAGGKHSKEAFRVYQGVAIAQAVVGTALAIMQALASAPPPYSFILAGISAAMGAVQIAAIAKAKPPSYDEGGISTTPGYYYSGVKEAHIPLKGGSIPVEMGEGAGTTIILENPVFQDLATQRATMALIAQSVVSREAPLVIERNYHNDGSMRRIIRSPL